MTTGPVFGEDANASATLKRLLLPLWAHPAISPAAVVDTLSAVLLSALLLWALLHIVAKWCAFPNLLLVRRQVFQVWGLLMGLNAITWNVWGVVVYVDPIFWQLHKLLQWAVPEPYQPSSLLLVGGWSSVVLVISVLLPTTPFQTPYATQASRQRPPTNNTRQRTRKHWKRGQKSSRKQRR